MAKSLLLLTLLASLLGAFCAKKSKVCRDQVLLQVSNQVSNQASSLTSATALRLRRRLAADPTVADRAAAALGVELKPMQRKLVNQLKAAGASNHSEHVSLLQRAEEDGAALMDQMATHMNDEFSRRDVTAARVGLFNEVAGATTTFFTQWASTGELPDTHAILTNVGGMIGGMISMVNPIVGAAFTMFVSVLGGLFGGPESDPMAELYEKIMEEVRELVTEKVNEAQAEEFRTEAKMLIKEMQFAYALFKDENNHQAAAGFEDQMNLVWLLIFQHDLRLIRYQLLGSSVCYPNSYPAKEACWNWHKQCTFLEVFEVINAERAAAVDAMRLEPNWGMEMEKRILKEIPDDVIGVLGEGQWACMDDVQKGSFEAEAHENAQKIYKAAWEKFPPLLRLSKEPHHKAYAEYATMRPGDSSSEPKAIDAYIDGDYGCLDHTNRVCGNPRGLLQGVYIPDPDISGGLAKKIEHLAYHTLNIDPAAAYDAAYSGSSTEGCNDGDFVTQLQSLNIGYRVGMKCNKPKEAAPFKGGWHDWCFLDSSRYHWRGCPAGMFIHKIYLSYLGSGPVEIECCPVIEPKEVTTTTTTTTSTTTTTTTTTSFTFPWQTTTTTPRFMW